MTKTLKIEAGKFYRAEDGVVGGPAFAWEVGMEHPYEIPGMKGYGHHSGENYRLYREDGTSRYAPNLVEEVPGPLRLEEGKFYRDAKGSVGGPAFIWNSTVLHPFEVPGLRANKADCNSIFKEDGTSNYGPAIVAEVADPSLPVKPEAPVSAGGGFFAGERIRLVTHPVRGYREIGEVFTAIPAASSPDYHETTVSYICKLHDAPTWSPASYWERADSVEVVEGGYYLAKNGTVVGPIKKSGDDFKCSAKSIQHAEGFSQYWSEDGSVVGMTPSEEDHVLVMRLDVPAKTYVDELVLKLSVDTSEAEAHLKDVQAMIDKVREESRVALTEKDAVAADQSERIGQLQAAIDLITVSNGDLYQLIETANTNCNAYRDSFVIASSDYFTTKAKLEATEAEFEVTKRNLARLAVIAQDQSDAINKLCDKNDWLQAKLYRTKAWCERFRKASKINADAASEWRAAAYRNITRKAICKSVPASKEDDTVPAIVWIKGEILVAVVFAAGVGCALSVI